jgi:hypothetical protein
MYEIAGILIPQMAESLNIHDFHKKPAVRMDIAAGFHTANVGISPGSVFQPASGTVSDCYQFLRPHV